MSRTYGSLPRAKSKGVPALQLRDECVRYGRRGPVAQRLEQQTHNLLVPGSNPGGPTNPINDGKRIGSISFTWAVSVNAFHEKAGRSQVGSFVFSLDKFFSPPSCHCRHPSIRTLQIGHA